MVASAWEPTPSTAVWRPGWASDRGRDDPRRRLSAPAREGPTRSAKTACGNSRSGKDRSRTNQPAAQGHAADANGTASAPCIRDTSAGQTTYSVASATARLPTPATKSIVARVTRHFAAARELVTLESRCSPASAAGGRSWNRDDDGDQAGREVKKRASCCGRGRSSQRESA